MPIRIDHRGNQTVRLSANALTVLKRRYLRKSDAGHIQEAPSQMFRRVADNIARAERLYQDARSSGKSARRASVVPAERRAAKDFKQMMARLDFLPNSPTLMNAGRELQQLSACFVLPVEDSLESIFETVKHQALIHQSGGGTGFSFSHLRPKGDVVHTTSGIASGPVSFMRVFNMATEVIKQGGTRRGANMGILRVDHPDILEFIDAKHDARELTNFNISVAITDAFMRAVEAGRDIALVNPRTGRCQRRIQAREVFDRLSAAAWENGEPGVIFLDTINDTAPTPHIGRIESTNPCGEQPLLPYESCTLGSLNVAHFTRPSRHATRVIDYDRLASVIHSAVRFLDNVLDMNQYPLPQIKDMTLGNRKVGLGIMGFADLLIHLDVPYNTEEALTLGERLMRFVWEEARRASATLAQERGVFPSFKGSRLESDNQRLRNATLTTIAPTGTISIIADCSPGIEPLYGVSFVRTVMEDVRLVSIHPEFVRRASSLGIYSPALAKRVAANESIQELRQIPVDLRRLFVTAHDIPADFHVRMQAAFQRYSDSGVSKTINLPASATKQDVAQGFLLAHRLGCKGVTVFRTGSRDKQVMSCTNVQYC